MERYVGEQCAFKLIEECGREVVSISEHPGDYYVSTVEDFIIFADLLKKERKGEK